MYPGSLPNSEGEGGERATNEAKQPPSKLWTRTLEATAVQTSFVKKVITNSVSYYIMRFKFYKTN